MILVNNTPEEKADALFEFISAENCVDTIIKLEPAAEPYKEWFEKLRTEVIEIMAEPDGEAMGESKELQDEADASTLPESQAVAGDADKESKSSGTSDGNPATNT